MNWNVAFDWLIHPQTPARDPYAVLGVPRNAKNEEIKRAYRKLMMTNHPDMGGDQSQRLPGNR